DFGATMRGLPLLGCLLLAGVCEGRWYLPGAKPKEYKEGDAIPMYVNSMSSVNTHLPFDYYSLPFCGEKQSTKRERENLGEILMGDRIKASPYEDMPVGTDFQCKVVCEPRQLNQQQAKRFESLIEDEYQMHLILDGLPVAVRNLDQNTFTIGFPLGGKEGKTAYINNHLHFTVKYHKSKAFEEGSAVRIIAFTVKPYSIKHVVEGEGAGAVKTCGLNGFDPVNLPLQVAAAGEPIETEEKWNSRWDVYLNVSDTDIHWFAIINSVMIAVFLSGILAMIMLRTVLRDIARYNDIEDPDDLHDETGWKQVHTEVFRPPAHKNLLACYVGTGVQLLGMCLTVLVLACLGFLSPANSGMLFTAILLFFVFLG
ncbi:Transmembrane 9 superfamily member 10, partial [Diplonema papillatum]